VTLRSRNRLRGRATLHGIRVASILLLVSLGCGGNVAVEVSGDASSTDATTQDEPREGAISFGDASSGPMDCIAAGGQCVLGSAPCAAAGPQDCNPGRNPGGAFCCLRSDYTCALDASANGGCGCFSPGDAGRVDFDAMTFCDVSCSQLMHENGATCAPVGMHCGTGCGPQCQCNGGHWFCFVPPC
jgi:hypothetical protein